jgi:radical SAM superfamily enzyme YgiQ (UPF0313 family)
MAQVEEAPQALMVPLHLATVAALTPEEFEVEIWDEGARGEIDDQTELGKQYDLVGVTGYIAHIPRAIELAHVFHRRGLPVVIGGPGVSGAPEQCRGIFDVIFLGEAELTWPRFLNEWKRGAHRKEYRQVERPDLTSSPAPRWDSITADVAKYRLAGVQTTRGCPYDCEFCDVIHLFGRQPRHKPVERVIEEIKRLAALGVRRVFMCDDDFIADRRYTKELLRALIPVNNAIDPPITYSTQLTIDLAKDEELMELMADCNFTQALIGIETPRAAGLEESHKIQNLRVDLVEACKKVQSYGIAVKSSLIVGFDSDDTAIFDEQIQFVEDANIAITTVNTMKAYPGTPLWVRLQRENRVVDVTEIYSDAPKVVSNIIPKGMTRVEMLEGWLRLVRHVRSWPSFARRAKSFISGIQRKPNVAPPSPAVRQQRMERMMKAQALLADLPEDARTAITDVITHTMHTAPYMMEHMSIIMMQQAMDAAVLHFHAEMIERQIEHTLSGRMKLAPDPSAGMIPVNFKSQVRSVLPDIWDNLEGRITCKPVVPEALVGVMKDFLIRWGASFDGFEDYHHAYIKELCDRHVERANTNGHGHVDTAGETNGVTLSRKDAQSSKFITAMLVAVEQEMRGQARSMLQPESVELTVQGAPAGAHA